MNNGNPGTFLPIDLVKSHPPSTARTYVHHSSSMPLFPNTVTDNFPRRGFQPWNRNTDSLSLTNYLPV